MDCHGNIFGIDVHLDGQSRFGDDIAGVRPDNPAPQKAMAFRIDQELCHALVPPER
jgi:hypothetical protein